MEKDPIFIADTRSFWLGIVPAVLTGVDLLFAAFSGSADLQPVAALFSYVLGYLSNWTPEQIASGMQALAPVYALIIAHQRSGASRPYSLNPKDTK